MHNLYSKALEIWSLSDSQRSLPNVDVAFGASKPNTP